MISIDDKIPVDSEGQPVLPTSQNPAEVWPLLIAKALLKLHHDEEDMDSIFLFSLCNWLPMSSLNKPLAPEEWLDTYDKCIGAIQFQPYVDGYGKKKDTSIALNSITPHSMKALNVFMPNINNDAEAEKARGVAHSRHKVARQVTVNRKKGDKTPPSFSCYLITRYECAEDDVGVIAKPSAKAIRVPGSAKKKG